MTHTVQNGSPYLGFTKQIAFQEADVVTHYVRVKGPIVERQEEGPASTGGE